MTVEKVQIPSLDFETLWDEFGNIVIKYAGLARVNGMEFDDVKQELTLTMLRCQELYDPRRANCPKFSTYLITAVKNKVGNLAAQGRRRSVVWNQVPPSEDGHELEAVGDVDHAQPTLSEIGKIRDELEWFDALSRLRPEEQQVIERVARTGRCRSGDSKSLLRRFLGYEPHELKVGSSER